MVLPRPTAFRTLLSQSRRTGPARFATVRSRFGQQVGRRYASGGDHGHSEGSDIPWLIGSVGLTAPAAFWLFQQGPDTHHEPHGGPLKHDFAHGDSEDEQAPEPVGEDKDEGGDDAKSDDSSSDDEGGKETPDTSDDEADDKGGEKKGDKSDEEGKGKDEGQTTNAQNPTDPHEDSEKSTKSEGVAETAKIQGTVDTSKRSPKGPEDSKDDS